MLGFGLGLRFSFRGGLWCGVSLRLGFRCSGGLLHFCRRLLVFCRWAGRRAAIGRDLEAQHANQLPGVGQHLNLPVAFHVLREVLLVRPGAIALLAAAMNIQGNTLKLLAVVLPHVVNALIQAARRIDCRVRVNTRATQLADAQAVDALTR